MDFIIQLGIYAFFAYSISLVCRKAGFSPILGFLAFVPLLNLVLLYYVAFARWPRFEEVGEAHHDE